MRCLILASASPARRATLAAAGLDPIVQVSEVDEAAALTAALTARPDLPPAGQVLALARAKARSVATARAATARAAAHAAPHPVPHAAGEVVIGCDSMAEIDGRVLGKPGNAREAARRIAEQSGRTVLLHTGHWLIGPDLAETGATSTTEVHFAELTPAEIAAYVATGEPLQVAGGFTIDGLGGPFIRGVTGDPHGVVGLSLPLLRDLLARLGLTVMDFWPAAPAQPTAPARPTAPAQPTAPTQPTAPEEGGDSR
ncbi:MAG: Maf family nucleotide pyrophosphatase [Bifidobacteriaceae bacterium]|jgi:septum formation protein|nr:Maf family nucleotide pyrophosphatase [Bifidobacteriaceae bacterium]